MKRFLTLVIAMSISLYSFSAILTWSGNTSTEFTEATNWYGNVAPGPSDAVFIPAGSSIAITSTVYVTRVIFDEDGGSTSNFMVSDSGNLYINGSSPLFWGENCNIVNNGSISLRSPDGYFGAMMLTTGADFQNNGDLSIVKTDSSFGGAIFMNDGANFDNNNGANLNIDSSNIGVYLWDDANASSFSNNTGGSVMMTNIKYTGFLGQNVNGPGLPGNLIENYGVVNIQTNYPYSAPIQGYGVYFLSSNFCFTNHVGATFNVSQNNPGAVQNNFGPSACVIFNGPMLLTSAEGNNNYTATNPGTIAIKPSSVIKGSGKVSATSLTVEGKIKPGPKAGHITFIDDFIQPATSSFEMEIYGDKGAGINKGNDFVEFQGSLARLHGKLNVELSGNYIPNIGDEFTLFQNTSTGGGIINQFSEINLPGGTDFWQLTEVGNSVKIKLTRQMAPCDQLAQAIPLDVKMISPTSAELSWEEVPEVDHYEINGRQILPAISPVQKSYPNSNSTSFIVQNIDPHHTYQWMIRPHCDEKESKSGPWSDVKNFTLCEPVKNTNTLNITDSEALLTWDVSDGTTNGYRIIGTLNGGSSTKIIDISNPMQEKYIVKNLNASTSYNWVILQNCGMNVYSDPGYSTINTFKTAIAKTQMVSEEIQFNLYPNPASDYIKIQSTLKDPLRIEVFDSKGSLVLRSSYSEILDINELSDGLYNLKISNENSYQTKTLIIN